jgi:ABC-type transport system involved in cytochrome c biogenesis permease component
VTFLPIVGRELRVAARHQFTYWSRPVAAAFPLSIFSVVLFFFTLARAGIPGFSPGRVEFSILGWMAFIYACCTGIFLTSDSLSEEKREGTLGLLFLTDLRGYDVVLGKLISQSLRAFYALVAAFPILALPLMMGGVTGSWFGDSLLVICNTLFFSLAGGMFVSSLSREVTKAMTLTLGLMLLFTAGLPWLDLGLAGWDQTKWECITSIASPGHLFSAVETLRPQDFRFQLGLQHALAWGFLALACVCVPRAWKEKSNTSTGWFSRIAAWWSFGRIGSRLAFRRKLLERNPIVWLASRDRGLSRLIDGAVIVGLASAGWTLIQLKQGWAQSLSSTSQLLTLVLLLWIALQASRFFVDAGRNGAMELILVTPASHRQIVQGQWSALWKMFIIPVLFLMALLVISGIGTIHGIQKSMQAANAASTTTTSFSYDITPMIVSTATGTVDLFFDFLALAWFGMWMGVTSRKTSIAVLKTICFVCVLPWIAEIIVQIGSMFATARFFIGPGLGEWPNIISTLVQSVLAIAIHLFLIFWSRHRLLTALRESVSAGGQSATRRWKQAVASIPAAAAPGPTFP